jgi:hypothetical protein
MTAERNTTVTTNLTPSAQAILEALRAGPASADELREQVHRSKSTTDKALNELAKAGLISQARPDDESDPLRWALTEVTTVADVPGTTTPDESAQEGATGIDTGPASTDTEPSDEPVLENLVGDEHAEGGAELNHSEATRAETSAPEVEPVHALNTQPHDRPDETPPTTNAEDAAEEPAAGTTNEAQAEEVKICRGCQEQMPVLCPCCWQKTTSYCGTCRKSGRQGAPGQRQTLFNGLPKLTNGELHRLILDVMQAQPLPEHHGITGWTGGRVAVFLPGRSTGAISKALESLTRAEKIQRIGDNPKRYQLSPSPDPESHEPPAAPASEAPETGQQPG